MKTFFFDRCVGRWKARASTLLLLSVVLSSCSFDRLYKLQQQRKSSDFQQVEFADMVKRYLSKDKSSVGTIEGIYSVSSYITKRGKGILSSTEKEKTVDRAENYTKVAIVNKGNSAGNEYTEIALDNKNYSSTYSVRGEFSSSSEGNILVYTHYESRSKTFSYTFTYDQSRDILEGVRTEKNGAFTITYKLVYLKLHPRVSEAIGSNN